MRQSMTALQERLCRLPPWGVTRQRDLLYIGLGANEVLVIAADSAGGLGPKPADTVAVPAEIVGRFAARVPLLEIVAAGAVPLVVVDTLAVERHPTGEAILAGVLEEAAIAGVAAEAVTGSTEDNVATLATGVGVTVLGRARIDDLRVGRAQPGDDVVLLGRPMSAPTDAFGPDHPAVLSVPALAAALELPDVREALPIGSSGVDAELRELARGAGASVELLPGWPVAPQQSAGPSTAALVAVAPSQGRERTVDHLRAATGLPAWLIARFEP